MLHYIPYHQFEQMRLLFAIYKGMRHIKQTKRQNLRHYQPFSRSFNTEAQSLYINIRHMTSSHDTSVHFHQGRSTCSIDQLLLGFGAFYVIRVLEVSRVNIS